MILGCVFLGVKVIEYQDKFANHEVPGASYDCRRITSGTSRPKAASMRRSGGRRRQHRQLSLTPEQLQQTTQLYFSLYFTMTGLHALHMIIGVGIMMVITWMAWKGKFDARVLHAGRDGRSLLALRRYRLDLPVPAAVSRREAR